MAEYLKEMQAIDSIEVKDSLQTKPDKMAVTMFSKATTNSSISGLKMAKPQTRQLKVNLKEVDVMASTHYDSARGQNPGLSTNSSLATR